MTSSLTSHADAARTLVASASRGLVRRQALVELAVLGAIAGEHLLVIGPPGTAKSQAVRRVAQELGGSYFEYLLGRFTEPAELFGTVDLAKLRDGRVEIDTEGMLPNAEIVFLDEVFLGSTAILNTLLGILNERTFRRGHTHHPVPLRLAVGASNELPEDPSLAAFADRFLLRHFVEPVPDHELEQLLEASWETEAEAATTSTVNGMAAIDALAAAVPSVDMTAARTGLAEAIRILRKGGVALTDRRLTRVQRLIAAAALADGRTTATTADLWVLVPAIPLRAEQEQGEALLHEFLADARNQTLPAAAEQASHGTEARAELIVRAGRALLDETAEAESIDTNSMLRLEAMQREIDATFPADQLPKTVAALRAEIATRLA